ncbi:hypothetical protein TcWFU_003870 [Taenia crassiceps]|uniref:Uncharacterized protein n=1 Tax=Taenia crassiceps TaxID=6207 RepID=A0ABR4Q7C5_9CEST
MLSTKLYIIIATLFGLILCSVETRPMHHPPHVNYERDPSMERFQRYLERHPANLKRFAVANSWDDFEDFRKRSDEKQEEFYLI